MPQHLGVATSLCFMATLCLVLVLRFGTNHLSLSTSSPVPSTSVILSYAVIDITTAVFNEFNSWKGAKGFVKFKLLPTFIKLLVQKKLAAQCHISVKWWCLNVYNIHDDAVRLYVHQTLVAHAKPHCLV